MDKATAALYFPIEIRRPPLLGRQNKLSFRLPDWRGHRMYMRNVRISGVRSEMAGIEPATSHPPDERSTAELHFNERRAPLLRDDRTRRRPLWPGRGVGPEVLCTIPVKVHLTG